MYVYIILFTICVYTIIYIQFRAQPYKRAYICIQRRSQGGGQGRIQGGLGAPPPVTHHSNRKRDKEERIDFKSHPAPVRNPEDIMSYCRFSRLREHVYCLDLGARFPKSARGFQHLCRR